MALNPSNSSNLEQLALKGLTCAQNHVSSSRVYRTPKSCSWNWEIVNVKSCILVKF